MQIFTLFSGFQSQIYILLFNATNPMAEDFVNPNRDKRNYNSQHTPRFDKQVNGFHIVFIIQEKQQRSQNIASQKTQKKHLHQKVTPFIINAKRIISRANITQSPPHSLSIEATNWKDSRAVRTIIAIIIFLSSFIVSTL